MGVLHDVGHQGLVHMLVKLLQISSVFVHFNAWSSFSCKIDIFQQTHCLHLWLLWVIKGIYLMSYSLEIAYEQSYILIAFTLINIETYAI